jgi:hypothetical protein
LPSTCRCLPPARRRRWAGRAAACSGS